MTTVSFSIFHTRYNFIPSTWQRFHSIFHTGYKVKISFYSFPPLILFLLLYSSSIFYLCACSDSSLPFLFLCFRFNKKSPPCQFRSIAPYNSLSTFPPHQSNFILLHTNFTSNSLFLSFYVHIFQVNGLIHNFFTTMRNTLRYFPLVFSYSLRLTSPHNMRFYFHWYHFRIRSSISVYFLSGKSVPYTLHTVSYRYTVSVQCLLLIPVLHQLCCLPIAQYFLPVTSSISFQAYQFY